MHHVRQQLPVHLTHLRPVSAVHVRHVEIVALVAPAFVEDLFELFSRLEIHAQRIVQTSGAGLRRRSISVDKEQLRRRSVCAAAEWTTTLAAATSGSAVNELATIGADLIRGDIADESVCASIAETITPQLAAAAPALPTATAATSRSRFKEKHL